MSLSNKSNRERSDGFSQKVDAAYVTCGADGALLVRNNKIEKIDGLNVEAIDTNGAGDMFAGGYYTALLILSTNTIRMSRLLCRGPNCPTIWAP